MFDFGANLRELRTTKRKLSMQQAADRLDIGKSTYAAYEANKYKPSFDVLMKLCALYDVDGNQILGFGDYKHKTLDIDDLDNEQITLLRLMIRQFEKANRNG